MGTTLQWLCPAAFGAAARRSELTAPKISFGTDGWRAVVADDFTYANVRAVTQAVAQYLASEPAEGRVVVGHDTRFSAELFAREVARVLAANSRQVLLSDRPSPTQVSAWLVVATGALGGVVVTASHNPPEFNGLKCKSEHGGSAPPEVVSRLEQELALVLEKDLVRSMPIEEAISQGLVELVDPRPPYRTQIARMVEVEEIRRAGLNILGGADPGRRLRPRYLQRRGRRPGGDLRRARRVHRPARGGHAPALAPLGEPQAAGSGAALADHEPAPRPPGPALLVPGGGAQGGLQVPGHPDA